MAMKPMKPTPNFKDWNSQWSNKKQTRKALALLTDVGGSERHQAITRHRITHACYEAAHYNPDRDPGQLYRQRITEEKKRKSQVIKAVRTLKLAAERDEKSFMWAMSLAEQSSGVRLARRDNTEPMAFHQVAATYYSHLENELESHLPELDGGPFLHHFTIGNLHFDKAISAGRPITASSMLAFELTVYMRMHTGGYAEDSPQQGMPMPAYKSEPCYPVVTAFCNAALGTSLWVEQVNDNVRKLKNVSLMGWPKPE